MTRGSVRVGSLVGVMSVMAMGALPGCITELSSREPFALGDGELVSGTYTYDRPEVGSIAGCTATLIGPRLVITAAHCVDYGTRTTPGRYGTFEIRRFAGDAQRYTIERYVSFGGTVGDDDVALLRLTSEVPASIATPAGLSRTDPASGERVTLFGYGCQVRGTSGAWAKQRLDVTFGRLSTNLCPGDSGGPTITSAGAVARINSGYYLDSVGGDIFGEVPVVYDRLARQAAAWGDVLGSGTPDAPPPDAGRPSDAGLDAGGGTPPPPIGDGPCARATCEEATALMGCGWCDDTGRGIRVGAYGEALEPCAAGYRLNPSDCGAVAQSTCGPWSGIDVFTCRRGGLQFVRCTEGSPPELLTCPSGYACIPGSTARYCYR